MTMSEFFAAQLEREAAVSRRSLARVPEGKDDWKPHPKSMPLGYLASLVATMPSWIAMMIDQDSLDLKPAHGGGIEQPDTSTNAGLLKAHDDAFARGLASLRATNDAHLETVWKLLVTGHVVQESPRNIAIADTFTHLAHHRGQLSVYLRLNDAKVPSIYGPTADEQTFG
jgi:uncharacterized damage-inducible protein DinB